jgi:GNAT superfamily N-acetyltransferase
MKIDVIYNDLNLTYEDFKNIDKECFPNQYYSTVQYTDMRENGFWTAYADNELAGYMSVKAYGKEMHLSRIAVSSDYRRKGIAHKLLNTLLSFSNEMKAESITLMVQTDNRNAISLYEKFGFFNNGSKCQFIIPIKEYMKCCDSKPRVTAVPIHGQNLQDHKYQLRFVSENGITIGGCFLNSEFPGCSYFEVEKPEKNFTDSLVSLKKYLIPEKDILVLTIEQKALIDSCMDLGFKLNYELFKMRKDL